MISGPATAGLVELDAHPERRRPALLAGLAQAGGSGLGPLVAGALAEWAPAPRVLCFVVVLVATVVAAVPALLVPEGAERSNEAWRIERPRVPDEIRGAFTRVAITAALAWGSLALYLSIVPSYSAKLLSTHDLALLGALAAVALAASCVALVVSQRVASDRRRTQRLGLVGLAAGLGLLAIAAPVHSLALLVLGAVCTGAGHGSAFLHAQDELNGIVPRGRRGEVTAAFICCIYAVVASSVIASGLLALRLSLTASVGSVAIVLAVAVGATAAWQLRD